MIVIDVVEQLVGCWVVLLTRIYQGLMLPKAGRVAFYRAGACCTVRLTARNVPAMAGARCVPGMLPVPSPSPLTSRNLMADLNRGKVTAELSQEENSKNHLPSFHIMDEVL